MILEPAGFQLTDIIKILCQNLADKTDGSEQCLSKNGRTCNSMYYTNVYIIDFLWDNLM